MKYNITRDNQQFTHIETEVSSCHAVASLSRVTYDIQAVGGVMTAFFGDEGLFVTTLTGPGKVLLQSMTLRKLAAVLAPLPPQKTGGGPSIRFGR